MISSQGMSGAETLNLAQTMYSRENVFVPRIFIVMCFTNVPFRVYSVSKTDENHMA